MIPRSFRFLEERNTRTPVVDKGWRKLKRKLNLGPSSPKYISFESYSSAEGPDQEGVPASLGKPGRQETFIDVQKTPVYKGVFFFLHHL